MSTRSTRRPQVQTSLSPLESLLLAQATWELGAGPNSWPAIAKLLSKHPLLSRPKSFFSAQSCHSMYEQLMKDAELEINESSDTPHASMNLKLAEKHFRSRHAELRELILAEELKFKTIVKEIDEIRSGLWDKENRPKVDDVPAPESATDNPDERPTTNGAQASDEIFDGSELSGVTESAESAASSSHVQDEQVPPSATMEQGDVQDPVTPPAEAPEDDSTPHRTVNSMAADIVKGPAGTTYENEELPLETLTTNSPPSSDPRTTPTPIDASSRPVQDADMDLPEKSEEHKEKNEQDKERTPSLEMSQDNGESSDSLVPYNNQKQEDEERGEEKGEEEEDDDDDDEEMKKENEEGSPRQRGSSVVNDDDEGLQTNVSDPDEELEHSEHAHTPTASPSEGGPNANEGHSSESEGEPKEPTRRSTRRRKSSVALGPPPHTRKRLRSQARLSEPRTAVESDMEDEQEMRDAEEEASSPFDGVMTRRREGKRKASFLENAESPLDKKRIREDSEPVDDDEAGPSSHNTRGRITRQGTRTEEQVALKRFQNVIGMLHSQISQHRNGNIFHNPIKNSEAPDYHDIVKRPMDLKTIKTRVKDGLIANSLEFQRDIFLMFANSMMYNRPGSDVYAMAEDMMLESEVQISAFRQTEGMVKRGQRP